MPATESLFQPPPSPVVELRGPLPEAAGLRLLAKRDDLLGTGPGLALCGNKWRKLQYNLLAARQEGHHHLLSFGGAFSNHIAALAAAGSTFGFQTTGIIRGERPEGLNPTLRFAEECGMQLEFVGRAAFRKKEEPPFVEWLQERFGAFYLLPEGGTNSLALQGCARLVEETEQQLGLFPDYWCCSLGTGGTFAGIVQGMRGRGQALGFSALKGDFHRTEVGRLLETDAGGTTPVADNWSVNAAFHFGGYARFNDGLVDFINGFYRQYGIPLDPIYTGKLFYGLFQLIREGYFPKGSTLLAVHTGGLQGITGFNERFGPLLEVGV